MSKNKISFKELFNRLQAIRIVADSPDRNKAYIEYRVTLSVEEYEQLRSMVDKRQR